MRWADRLLRHLGELDFSRAHNLDLVELIHARHLKPHLGGPKELYARAVAQFQGMKCCRSARQGAIRRVVSVPLLLLFLLKNALRGIRKGDAPAPETVDGVKTGGPLKEYELPPELSALSVVAWDPTPSFLSWRETLGTIRGLLLVGCWEPEVHYKALAALSAQAGLFRRYRPRFVVMYKEFDFTASLLTLQCRMNGAEAYDVMHGDKFYFARDAFFAFDRYYVWHAGYGEMARDMKADPGKVVVYLPHRMTPPPGPLAVSADILVLLPGYPLAGDEEDAWLGALAAMAAKWRVKIRPHPRYPFNPRLQAAVGWAGVERSDPSVEGAVEAIRGARVVVGYQSTVLIEALCQGAGVICILDRRLAQVLDYHPFFKDPRIRKASFETLEMELEGSLA